MDDQKLIEVLRLLLQIIAEQERKISRCKDIRGSTWTGQNLHRAERAVAELERSL